VLLIHVVHEPLVSLSEESSLIRTDVVQIVRFHSNILVAHILLQQKSTSVYKTELYMYRIVISTISYGQTKAHKLPDTIPIADLIPAVALLSHTEMPTGFSAWEQQRIQHRICMTRPLWNVINGIYYFKCSGELGYAVM